MKKKAIIAAVVLEVILLFVNALSFNRDESYEFSQDDLYIAHYDESLKETLYEPGFYADHSNVAGSYIVTAAMTLRKGIYNISVNYSGQNTGTWHNCYTSLEPELDTSKEKTADLVNSDRNALPDSGSNVSYLSWVRYETPCRVRTGPSEDESGDNMYVLVDSVTVTYMRGKTILHEETKLFLFFVLIDILLYLGIFKRAEITERLKGKELVAAALLFAVFFSSYPLAYRKLYFGDDIYYHLMRVAYLADGLRSGQFPVHIYPGWDNGYGYAAGVGYGDLLLYPSAFLVNLGFTIQFAYKFYIFLTNLLTVSISYFCFKKISGSEKVGGVCSVLFTLMGFRLHSVYAGATVGEFGAYTFLPLVILGLWDIYNKEKTRGDIILALGITLTLSCHVLSTFILALLIPLLCLVLIEKTVKREVLFPLLNALLWTVLLNLHFIVPLTDYLLFQGMRGNDNYSRLWSKGKEFVELFWHVSDISLDSGGFLGIGIYSAFIVVLAAAFVISGRFKEKTGVYLRILILNVFLIFLSVNSIFYFWLMDKLPMLYKLLGTMQFPWHFLDVSCGLITFWAAVIFGAMESSGDRMSEASVISIVCALCVIQGGMLLGETIAEANPITMFDDTEIRGSFYAEFSIDGVDEGLIFSERDMVIRKDTDAQASMVSKNGCTVYADVTNNTDEAVTVEAPLWGYRHYKARAGNMPLMAFMAESGKLAVEVPAGFDGQIKIYFSEPWYWRLSELASLISAVCVFVLLKKKLR